MGKSPSAWWNWSDDLANDEQILAVTLGIGDIVREYFLRVSVDKTLLRATIRNQVWLWKSHVGCNAFEIRYLSRGILYLSSFALSYTSLLEEVPLTVNQLQIVVGISYQSSLGFAKASICTFYPRLSPHKPFRITTYCEIAFVFSYTVAGVGVIIFSCKPIAASWDLALSSLPTTKCVNRPGLPGTSCV